MPSFLFWLFAVLMLGGGVAVVAFRNPVSSAMSVVASFVGLAALFVGLSAFFVIVQGFEWVEMITQGLTLTSSSGKWVWPPAKSSLR